MLLNSTPLYLPPSLFLQFPLLSSPLSTNNNYTSTRFRVFDHIVSSR